MRTQTEDIGLAKAETYLENNIAFEYGRGGTNRPVTIGLVNYYAVQMLRGHWKHTHQGIAFNTNGHISDGQQRLMALVQACTIGAWVGIEHIEPQPKLKIKFQVTHGLEPDVFPYLDRGKTRTTDQILAMAGYKNTLVTASAARIVYMYENVDPKFWRRTRFSPEDALELVAKTNLDEYYQLGHKLSEIGMIKAAGIAATYLCMKVWPEGPHDEFIESVISGVGLESFDDPRLAFRNYMFKSVREAKNRLRRDTAIHTLIYIKAWNDFALGKKHTVYSFKSNEKLPVPTTGE